MPAAERRPETQRRKAREAAVGKETWRPLRLCVASPSTAAQQPPASLYLHIPFCRAKCAYCDFSSYPLAPDLYPPYVAALRAEMEAVGRDWQRPILHTLYIGGGTPTLLAPSALAGLIEAASAAFALADDAEITIEANPGTVTLASLRSLLAAGANRLSLGVQSLNPPALRLLGRIHSAAEALQAVELARQAGFANLNLDLIYGLPGQEMPQWQADLEAALACAPEHLSLYALTLEEGTPLQQRVACREAPAPDADTAASMYEWSQERLAVAGYVHYEISNWALAGHECRHNLTYWHNLPYAGCGAAAHSWLRGHRRANVASPQEYMARLERGESPVAEDEAISPALERAETVILGLRLLQGLDRATFRARFGVEPVALYPKAVAETSELGLLEVTPQHLRLTPRGRLLGNQVFWRFLP